MNREQLQRSRTVLSWSEILCVVCVLRPRECLSNIPTLQLSNGAGSHTVITAVASLVKSPRHLGASEHDVTAEHWAICGTASSILAKTRVCFLFILLTPLRQGPTINVLFIDISLPRGLKYAIELSDVCLLRNGKKIKGF